MKELLVKLNQAKEDRRLQNEASDKEIASLEKQITEEEVTYSIGDRFNIKNGGKVIIVKTGISMAGLRKLGTGSTYGSSFGGVKVSNLNKITKDEFLSMGCRLDYWNTRYWDSRKQEYVGEELDHCYVAGVPFRVTAEGTLEIVDIGLSFSGVHLDELNRLLDKMISTAKKRAKHD